MTGLTFDVTSSMIRHVPRAITSTIAGQFLNPTTTCILGRREYNFYGPIVVKFF
jgi:hypothetical protein